MDNRLDSHSFSQESSSEHHNHSLEDLSDEQIQAQLEDLARVNQQMTLENQIFEKYMKKVEPFLTAANMGGPGSSSSLSTTPSGSTYDVVGSNAPPVAGSVTGSRYGNRKRSKSRSTQSDYRMRLTVEQKCDIASKEIDELKSEKRKAADEAEKNADSFKAILEEADIRIGEIRKEMYEFERDVVRGARNPLTKRIIAERLLKYLEDRIKNRDSIIEKLKLKNSSMRKKRQKLLAELKEKEELGEVLHEVDFKQLKIENKQYIDKIDEKNSEMIKLKKMVGQVTQTLNYRKKQLNLCSKEYDTILTEIKTRASILEKLENETKIVRVEHAKEEGKNKRLRAQLENYKVPEVNDYVSAEDRLYEYQKEVKVWERKVEISEMAFKINKKEWNNLKSNSLQNSNRNTNASSLHHPSNSIITNNNNMNSNNNPNPSSNMDALKMSQPPAASSQLNAAAF